MHEKQDNALLIDTLGQKSIHFQSYRKIKKRKCPQKVLFLY